MTIVDHHGSAKIVITGDPKVGSTIELSNADNTGVRVWHWRLLPPDGSEAFLADPMLSKASFKIDRPGAYAVQLRVNAGRNEVVDRTAVLVPESAPDFPTTAIAQLREISTWLSRSGIEDLSTAADDLADRIEGTFL